MTRKSDEEPVSAADIARAVRAKEISPVEIVEATLLRVEKQNPSLNALIYVDEDGARQSARALEQRLMAGEDLGPLAGVPTAIKDLFMTKAGWITTFGGIGAFSKFAASNSSHYPKAMEAAGAVIIGNTNSPVLGFRGTCDNSLYGATCNPFDLARNSGGSSGGSAAAVADGMLPIAAANDGGGSIRIPAAWSGVFGFQPSFGRVPQRGFDLSTFVYESVVSRTVEDSALSLSVLAQYDRLDPFSSPEPIDWLSALGRPMRGKKIGFSPDLGTYPIDPRIAGAVQQAVKVFETLGAEILPIDSIFPFDHRELTNLWCRFSGIRMVGAREQFRAWGIDLTTEASKDIPPAVWEWIDRAEVMTIADLRRDFMMRSVVFESLQAVLASVDFLACPTVAALPVENRADGATVGPTSIGGVTVDPLIGWCLTYMTNFTGHPAASLPAGLAGGLPVGLQLIGQRRGDLDLMAACAAFEEASPWIKTYDKRAARPLIMP